MAKKIIITVDPKGRETIQTVGFEGAACTSASAAFERGLKERQEAKTAEYYAGGDEQQSISVGA